MSGINSVFLWVWFKSHTHCRLTFAVGKFVVRRKVDPLFAKFAMTRSTSPVFKCCWRIMVNKRVQKHKTKHTNQKIQSPEGCALTRSCHTFQLDQPLCREPAKFWSLGTIYKFRILFFWTSKFQGFPSNFFLWPSTLPGTISYPVNTTSVLQSGNFGERILVRNGIFWSSFWCTCSPRMLASRPYHHKRSLTAWFEIKPSFKLVKRSTRKSNNRWKDMRHKDKKRTLQILCWGSPWLSSQHGQGLSCS